jgi:hypothetical protein
MLGEDRGPELSGDLGGLPGEGRLPAAGGHGADLGQLPVAFGLHPVGGLAFGEDVLLVLGQLVGGGVAALGGGPGQDFVAGGVGGGPLLPELVEQRHGATSSIPHLDSRDARNSTTSGVLVVLRVDDAGQLHSGQDQQQPAVDGDDGELVAAPPFELALGGGLVDGPAGVL